MLSGQEPYVGHRPPNRMVGEPHFEPRWRHVVVAAFNENTLYDGINLRIGLVGLQYFLVGGTLVSLH